MNAVVLLVVGVAILVAGYIFYGGWLAKQWGLGENKEETPAHTMEDGQDYVPAKAPVLMGIYRWCRTYKRTYSGRCFWLDSCYALGFNRRYLLRCYS